ncbi:MAG: InlB B-repeat-containing protein [Bacteroidota bacterium]
MRFFKAHLFLFLSILSSCVKHHLDDGIATISVNVHPAGSGIVSGAGDYNEGDSVTLNAIPARRMVFVYWEEDGRMISSSNPYRFLAGPDRQLTAVFEDYRERLLGAYSGTRNNYSWIMSNPIAYDTTFAYSFTVESHPSVDSIRVDNRVFPFDTTLKYYSMPYPGQITSLEFIGDTCKMYFRSGGLGGFGSTTITGLKN